ncbi:BTAD domain-containing putative transcriptional regulator [Streptomyces sp. NPDC047886]|uniref:BTAD domain-containing putative transcriptional regulator n=1 Tax=Streptomyces sp. NPDC047886 TaxID=3365490 RepID=UPI00370FC3C1
MLFGVLGPLTVWGTDGRPVPVPGAKVRTLLARLLVDPGRPVSADRLVDDLWGDALPDHPRNTLQGKASQLRRVLRRAAPDGPELLVAEAGGYALRITADAVDAGRFSALAGRKREGAAPRARAAALSEALGLWRGEPFSGFAEEPFARAEITRLSEERLTALEELAETRLELDEGRTLIAELEALVAAHPLRERLRAAHMRALYRAGRQTEALDSYDTLRRHLDEELGLVPGAALASLRQAILRQDPALDAPARTNGTRLPAPVTRLVGRDDDLDGIARTMTASRLVTLTGPGGVGKTRLAVESARRSADEFPDGVWLVELASLDPEPGARTGPDATPATGGATPPPPPSVATSTSTSTAPAQTPTQTSAVSTAPPGGGGAAATSAVAEAVLKVLGVREEHDDDGEATLSPVQRLVGALGGRRILLVLDNCEHVVRPVTAVVVALLREAPGLTVLATSQEPLRITGEAVWQVPPLSLPDAIQLFTSRATAPVLAPGGPDAEAVALLCRRLDGIPLALELAASRVRTAGVHGLLNRLGDRFGVLTGGARDAPERQRTLRAVLDWSWDLLTTAERTVLRRLSVHAEGCALEAAEAVCAGDGVPAAEVRGLLESLVDRSLVVLSDRPDTTVYHLLETVRAYGRERLAEAGESGAVRERHSRYHSSLALRAAPLLRGPEQRRWLERLDGAGADLRRALDHTVAANAGQRAARMVNALAWYWVLRGRLTEASRALDTVLGSLPDRPTPERALAMAWRTGIAVMADAEGDGDTAARIEAVLAAYDEVADPEGHATALWFLGSAQMGAGAVTAGETLVNRALDGFTALGDDWGTAAALSVRARHAMARGDLAAVRRDGEESAKLFRAAGDRWGWLQTVFPLAALSEIGGDYEAAGRLQREGLAVAEELGLAREAAKRLCGLGRLALLTGCHAQARTYHERARELAREHHFRSGEVDAELGLALGARREGDHALAESRLRSLLAWFTKVGYGPGITLVTAELGFVAEHRGDADAARALHLQGLEAATDLGDPRARALALEGLAGAFALAGRHREAALLLGAAEAARTSVGAPLPPAERGDVDRVMTAARVGLGPREYAAAHAEGATLDREGVHAVAYTDATVCL